MFTNLPLNVEIGLIVGILLSSLMVYFDKKLSIGKMIIVFIASIFFTITLFSLFGKINKIVTYPTYEAIIIHVDEHEEDDEGGSYLMYTPTYALNVDGKEVHVTSHMSSGGEFEIGEEVKIAYKDGKFLEYNTGTIIFTIGTLIGLAVTFFTLFIIMGRAVNKQFETVKYGLLLIRVIFSLFLLLVIFGILKKFWVLYLGEEYISNMGVLALSVMLFIATIGLRAMIDFSSVYNEEKPSVKEKRKKKRKKRRKSLSKKKEEDDLNTFDSNIVSMIGILFFSSIFSIIGIVMYSDEGINLLVVVFSAIGAGGTILSLYFYLSYLYFRNLSFKLYTKQIRKDITIEGSFILRRAVSKSTDFTVALINTHRIPTIDSDGERDYKIKTLWRKEETPIVKQLEEGVKIPFSLSSKGYTKGRLKITIYAKTKWISFSRSYILKEEG